MPNNPNINCYSVRSVYTYTVFPLVEYNRSRSGMGAFKDSVVAFVSFYFHCRLLMKQAAEEELSFLLLELQKVR